MGQSIQTIQRQRDQPVISQVPDEGKAERETAVRVLLLVVSQPSRGLESHAPAWIAPSDVMLKWSWLLRRDHDPLEINVLILQSLGKMRARG